MKLFDAEWAPSPRRVRIYLAEKGITVEREVIDLKSNAQRDPGYLKLNPQGVVPALLLDSGEVIGDSVAICRYFEALQPDPPLFGRTPEEMARVEEWSRRIESDGYAAVIYAFRNGHPAFAGQAAPGGLGLEQIAALVPRGQRMWNAFVRVLEDQLGRHEWIAGERYSFADIMALVTLDFAPVAKLTVSEDCAQVRRWHDAAAAPAERPSIISRDQRSYSTTGRASATARAAGHVRPAQPCGRPPPWR